MKSVISNVTTTKPRYPYLGRNGVLVVLFSSYECGTVIWAKEGATNSTVGDYNTDWYEAGFIRTRGTVTITND